MEDQTDDGTKEAEDDINIFKLFYREAVREHQATCTDELCANCTISADETHNWASQHRFGVLAKKFDGKSLRQHLHDRGWASNSWPTSVATPIDTATNKPGGTTSGLSKLSKLIAKEKRMKSTQNSEDNDTIPGLVDSS